MHLLTDVEDSILRELKYPFHDNIYHNKYEELLVIVLSMNDARHSGPVVKMELQSVVEDILSQYDTKTLTGFFSEISWVEGSLAQLPPTRNFMSQSIALELVHRIAKTIYTEAYVSVSPPLPRGERLNNYKPVNNSSAHRGREIYL